MDARVVQSGGAFRCRYRHWWRNRFSANAKSRVFNTKLTGESRLVIRAKNMSDEQHAAQSPG